MRDWSYEELAREVRANLVYREFTRIGAARFPMINRSHDSAGSWDRKWSRNCISVWCPLLKRRKSFRAQTPCRYHGRRDQYSLSDRQHAAQRRRESAYPGDGKKVTEVAGQVGAQLRDRTRSVKHRILEIARASRDKSEKGKQKLAAAYGKLLETTSRVVGQAKKFSAEIAGKVKRGPRKVMQKARRQLDEMIPRLQQVLRQTRQRVLGGDTRAEGKIVSVFELQTEVIRKGKAVRDRPQIR